MGWFDDATDAADKGFGTVEKGVDDAFDFFNPKQADSLYNGGGSMSEDMNYAIKNAKWESTATPEEKKLAHTHGTNPNSDYSKFMAHNPFAYLYD